MTTERTTFTFVHQGVDGPELRHRYWGVLSAIEGVELEGSPDGSAWMMYEEMVIGLSAPEYPGEYYQMSPDLPCMILDTSALYPMGYEEASQAAETFLELAVTIYERLDEKPEIVYGMSPDEETWCVDVEENPFPVDEESLAATELNIATWVLILPEPFRETYDETVWQQSPGVDRAGELSDGSLLVVMKGTPTEEVQWWRTTQDLGLPGIDS